MARIKVIRAGYAPIFCEVHSDMTLREALGMQDIIIGSNETPMLNGTGCSASDTLGTLNVTFEDADLVYRLTFAKANVEGGSSI